jgi:tRNA pseudouridine38-40 synthase
MPKVRLTLEYDGTRYVGWQVQPNGPSIQSELEKAIANLVQTQVPVIVAGRTDAGVHARGQVVAFTSPRELPLKAWVRGLNGVLPKDIAVVDAAFAPDDFDPRRWATGKRYVYRVSNRPTRSPLLSATHWEVFQPLDVEAMRAAAPVLLGRHDYSAFRAANCQAAHAVREVRRIEIEGAPREVITFTVEGTAFVKNMVRNLVGTLVEVGKGRQKPEWVAEVLASKDRTRAGPCAPPQGLTLEQVFIGEGPVQSSSPEEEE